MQIHGENRNEKVLRTVEFTGNGLDHLSLASLIRRV